MFRCVLAFSVFTLLHWGSLVSAQESSKDKKNWVGCIAPQRSIEPSKLSSEVRLASKDILTDCGATVFVKLLEKKGRTDWSASAYQAAARITDVHARRSFEYLLDRNAYLNWQDTTYFEAAKIDSDKKEAVFKTMIDHVKLRDYPGIAYRVLNGLKSAHQFEVFEKMISYSINWKDSVYEAVGMMPQDDEHNYVGRAFQELLTSAKRFDWPAAAYKNVIKVKTEDQYSAFKTVVENYNIFIILTTKNFNAGANLLYDAVSPILNSFISVSASEPGMNPYRAAEKLHANLASIAQHSASSAWETFKSTMSPTNLFAGTMSLQGLTNLWSSLSLNNVSGAFLFNKMRTIGFKGLIKEMAGGAGAIFTTAKGAAAGLAGSTTGAAMVGAAAIGALSYPYLQSYFEYKTVADVVFDSAANISSPLALKVFNSLVKQARVTDWPAEAYMEAAAIRTHAQERRFKFLISKSKLVNYDGTTYSIAAREMNDGENTISFGEKAFLLLASNSPYNRKYYDWPVFLYDAASSVKNKYAYAVFEELSKSLKSDTRNWLFRHDTVARTFPEVDNEYSEKAVLRLLTSRYSWAGKVYDTASTLKSQSEYQSFLDDIEKNQENQDWMMFEGKGLEYASYGLQALFLFAVVSYMASDMHIDFNCGENCQLDAKGKEFIEKIYSDNDFLTSKASDISNKHTEGLWQDLLDIAKHPDTVAEPRVKYLSLVVAVARALTRNAAHPEKSVAFTIDDPDSKLYTFLLGYFSFSNPKLQNKSLGEVRDILEAADNKNTRNTVDKYSSSHVYNRTAKQRLIRRSSHLLQRDLIEPHQWGIDLRLEDGGPALSALLGGKSTILLGRFKFKNDGPWFTYFKPEEVGIGVDSDNLRHGLEFLDSLGASDSNNRSEKIGKSKALKDLVVKELTSEYAQEPEKEKARLIKADLDKRTLANIYEKSTQKEEFKKSVEAIYTGDTYINIETRLGNEIQIRLP